VNRRPTAAPMSPARGVNESARLQRVGFSPPNAPVAVSWEAKLGQLTELVEQFRVDAERYFNGGLALPPEELRTRIHALLRELRTGQLRAAADQFRFASLEARFSSISELFGRRLREREEGRSAIARAAAEPIARHDATAGIVFPDAGDRGAVEALWGALARSGGRTLELETFRVYLTRQIDDIRAKTGAAAVQFRVVADDGKLKLKAKPLAASATEE